MFGQEVVIVPFDVIIKIQQSDQQKAQEQKKDTFFRLSKIFEQCTIGAEKHPENGIYCRFPRDI